MNKMSESSPRVQQLPVGKISLGDSMYKHVVSNTILLKVARKQILKLFMTRKILETMYRNG